MRSSDAMVQKKKPKISEKSKIPHLRHHTQELPSLFKLRKVLILVVGFSQMRMRLSPSEDH